MTRVAAASLVLAGCGGGGGGGEAGDFNGRVTGSVESVLRGTAWFCDGPRGAMLVLDDARRGSMLLFEGAQGSLRSGAWLVRKEIEPNTFAFKALLQSHPDPDAERLEWVVRDGTLTVDSVAGSVASGRYKVSTVTVDVVPRDLGGGRVARLPNRASELSGFFTAPRRECPTTPPTPTRPK